MRVSIVQVTSGEAVSVAVEVVNNGDVFTLMDDSDTPATPKIRQMVNDLILEVLETYDRNRED